MSWGSFLVGGVVFGFFFFILGVLLGSLSSSSSNGSGFSKLVDTASKNLKDNETVTVHLLVGKNTNDDDGDFDLDPDLDPVLDRDKWEPN